MRRSELSLAILAIGLAVVLYGDMFLRLGHRWNIDPNSGHGYLVPVMSVYLAYRRRPASNPFGVVSVPVLFLGLMVCSVGILALLLSSMIRSLLTESFSFLMILTGTVLVTGGRAAFQWLRAPIAFLVFMIPWPPIVTSRIAMPLQLFTSQMAVGVFAFLGVPAMRSGNLIQLPGQTMHVAEACSGLRQLIAFLAIGVCASLLIARPRWYRATLLLSAIPIAVFTNTLRVTSIGLLSYFGDPRWTTGVLHTAEGLVMVAMGLGLFMMEISVLDWMLEERTPCDECRVQTDGLAASPAGNLGRHAGHGGRSAERARQAVAVGS